MKPQGGSLCPIDNRCGESISQKRSICKIFSTIMKFILVYFAVTIQGAPGHFEWLLCRQVNTRGRKCAFWSQFIGKYVVVSFGCLVLMLVGLFAVCLAFVVCFIDFVCLFVCLLGFFP